MNDRKEPSKKIHRNMHYHDISEIELDQDIPIFRNSVKTFTNFISLESSENIYIRYNLSPIYEQELINYYRSSLLANGWELNEKRTDSSKMTVKKNKRYMTIRFFEMKEEDTISLAYSINLVRPKSEGMAKE